MSHMTLRSALVSAAEEAHRDGEITRLDLFTVRLMSRRPSALAQVQQAVEEEAQSQGLLPAAGPGAFDWAALLALIKELLPIILMFFQRS